MLITTQKVKVVNNNGKYKRALINLSKSASDYIGLEDQDVVMMLFSSKEKMTIQDLVDMTKVKEKRDQLEKIKDDVNEELDKIQNSVYVEETPL